jgi:type VI secretion system protein ImpJ
MDIERPLLWHQGMFLQPQHFQLQERCFQALLSPFPEYLAPHFWGVGAAEIPQAPIGTGTFQISKGSFLFPDGSHAVVPGNAVVESRPFTESWIEGGRPLAVFVGLKRWNGQGENVTVVETPDKIPSITTRFVSPIDPEGCRDLHAGGPQSEVKRLSYVLRIFWGNEVDELGDYLLIPVAQLERTGQAVALSRRYVPPCLTLSGSDTLINIVKEIRDQVASRGRQLEAFKRQRGIQSAEFGSRDMVYLLALRSLNRYLPLLFHATETKQIHPWAVYGLLRQLVGEFSSFSETTSVLGERGGNIELPSYDHRALGECFSAAQALIIRLLDEITAGPEYVIQLLYDGTYFAAELKPSCFEGANRFYLVLKTEENAEAVLKSISTVAKLSARERLPILIASALQGIRLEHLPVVPQELPRRPDSLYFAIDTHHDQWSLVEKGKNIAFYWDSAPEDLEVELMVISRK